MLRRVLSVAPLLGTCASVAVFLLYQYGGAGCQPVALNRTVKADNGLTQPLKPVPIAPPKTTRPDRHAALIVLDGPTIENLRRSAKLDTEAWQRTHARCETRAEKPVKSGYQAFEWADAMATLAICWHATGDDRYARVAIQYLEALLDDRFVPGNKRGGADVVEHDSGYGIRTFGAYSALGYDWLRHAPGMNEALRKRIRERLSTWLAWYQAEGYLRDNPISNYFWGYFTTLSLAGLATSPDTVQGKRWLAEARRLLSERIVPAFQTRLRGGGWPEGWQYGNYVAFEVAFVARAFETAAQVPLVGKFPWLAELARHHLHAMPPDESIYGGGTWAKRPAKTSALALNAAAIALEAAGDERHAAEARWVASERLPPLDHQHTWVALLANPPGAKEIDPRQPGETSLYLRGLGLTFMRSRWSPNAIWASFQAGPRLTPDHQHNDQGHFEIWHGSDPLLVDWGDSEARATINHNTLLVDDGGKLLDYAPNQGVWGFSVDTTRFADDGKALAVTGDITNAYAPSCVREGCTQRSVLSAVRHMIYVRPGLFVIFDQVTLAEPDYGLTWSAHSPSRPEGDDARYRVQVGDSQAEVQTLYGGASSRVVREQPQTDLGPFAGQRPLGTVFRLEVASPRGQRERHFVHWITTGAVAAPARPARDLSGTGLRGGLGDVSGERIAVLLSEDAKGGSLTVGAPVDELLLAGLKPGQRYRVLLTHPDCQLQLQPASNGESRANAGGFVRLTHPTCERKH